MPHIYSDTFFNDYLRYTCKIKNKIKELDKEDVSPEVYKSKFQRIVEKSCLCMGLGAATEQIHGMQTERPAKGVAVCPGPNMAYFSKTMSLKEITDHIYGRINIINTSSRPNMFIKELKMYIDYLKAKIDEASHPFSDKQIKYFDIIKFTSSKSIGKTQPVFNCCIPISIRLVQYIQSFLVFQ